MLFKPKVFLALTALNSLFTAGVSQENSTSNNLTSSNSSSLNWTYVESPPPSSEFNQTNSYKTNDYDFYEPETWTLWTNKVRNNSYAIQPYAANGYIGVRLPVQGQGFSVDQNYTDKNGTLPVNGWPLDNERFTGAYIAGFWDTQKNTTRTNFPELLKRGGESVISTIPVWTSLQVRDSRSKMVYSPENGPNGIETYIQSLSLKRALVQTNVTWKPQDVSYKLNYTVVTHRTRPNLGIVRLDLSADSNTTVDLADILDGAGSMRTVYLDSDMDNELSIWTAVRPHWLHNVTGYEYSTLWFSDQSAVDLTKRNSSDWASNNESTISQQFPLQLKQNQTITIIKYVGITSTDAYPVDTFREAKYASETASRDGWDMLIKEHTDQWAMLWDQSDIIIPSDQELQISARATIFHLLSNVRDGSETKGFGDNSIAVGGLSSDSYGGMIFWDADLWMNPGLSVLYPNHAASINNYRTRLRNQAIANAKSYNESGALYPWTSARWGNCTGTGPCVDYQYHLNIDIALSQWHYYLQTKDNNWLESTGYPIMHDAAQFFAGYVKKNGSQYETYNLTDPDEYANHVNNGAYTNGAIMQLMKWTMRASEILGRRPDPRWKDISTNLKIPENKTLDLTLEFDGMNGTADIKQADVVLLQYPMEFPQSKKRAMTNLDYYALRQSPDGPAMTYAMFAIDKMELNTEGCSGYTYLTYAHQPYLRLPYYQFSEQLNDNANTNGGTHPAFPFLTGHGGYLQVYTHGLTGYRARENVLHLDPSLPPQIEGGVLLKGFKFQGAVFDINITLTDTYIHRREDHVISLQTPWNETLNSSSISNSNYTYFNNNSNGTSEPHHMRPVTIEIGSRNGKAGNHTLRVNQTLIVPTYRSDLNDTLFDGNIAECKPASTQQDWIAGNFPFAMNDGDNSTFWQPLHSSKSSVMIDLGKAQRFNSAYFLWGELPPRKVSLGIPQGFHGSNLTNAQKVKDFHWIMRDTPVTLSYPWSNNTNMSIVQIRPGNDSMFEFNSTYESRFVQVAIEGSFLNDTRGGRISEFSLV